MPPERDDQLLNFDVDTAELLAFLRHLPVTAQKTRMIAAARFFDVAQKVSERATEMTPVLRGHLTASILKYAVRDDESGGFAKRGVSTHLSVGATVSYARYMHDGNASGEPYALGLGTQPKTARKKAKGVKTTFRVPMADRQGGTVMKRAYRLGGSTLKNTKTGVVGWKFLSRALDEHKGELLDWRDFPPRVQRLVNEAIRAAKRETKTS